MFKGTATAIVLMVALGGVTADVAPAPEPVIHFTAPTPAPVERACTPGAAVVGDSITSWDPPYARNPAQSWVTTAAASVSIVGGWAYPGANLGQMLENVTPVPGACYLIVMGGTNDIVQYVPIRDRLDIIDAIVATVGAEQVVVSAVAPLNLDPAGAVEWNATLAAYAAAEGYVFIDPWEDFRTESGEWVAGASLRDGVHPAPATAAFVGSRIAAHLQRLDMIRDAHPATGPVAF